MNVVILSGNLVRDPEKSYASSGKAIARFTIAVNRAYAKKTEGGQDADFLRITCFDKQAELVDKYLSKGSKVGVEGRIQTGSYQGKDGNTVYTTDVVANRVEFLDSRRDPGNVGFDAGDQIMNRPDFEPAPPPAMSDEPVIPGGFDEIEDDMPF